MMVPEISELVLWTVTNSTNKYNKYTLTSITNYCLYLLIIISFLTNQVTTQLVCRHNQYVSDLSLLKYMKITVWNKNRYGNGYKK